MNRLLAIVMLIAVALGSSALYAQDKKKHGGKSHAEMRKEMRDYKLKFLLQEMELNEETQAKFSELFKEHFEAQGKLFREKRQAKKALEVKSEPTDADYQAYQKVEKSVKEREQAIDQQYRNNLDKILSPKQRYKLQQAEDEFRAKMHEMRAKKGHGHRK